MNSTLEPPSDHTRWPSNFDATFTDYKAAEELGIPRRTIRSWNDQNEIFSYQANMKRIKISPGGRGQSFSDPNGLIEMSVLERALTTTHLINRIKRHQMDWLRNYLHGKAPGTAYQRLILLLQRFCHRHSTHGSAPASTRSGMLRLKKCVRSLPPSSVSHTAVMAAVSSTTLMRQISTTKCHPDTSGPYRMAPPRCRGETHSLRECLISLWTKIEYRNS